MEEENRIPGENVDLEDAMLSAEEAFPQEEEPVIPPFPELEFVTVPEASPAEPEPEAAQAEEPAVQKPEEKEPEPEPVISEAEAICEEARRLDKEVQRAIEQAKAAHKKRRKIWKKEARKRARAFLKEKRAAKDAVSKNELREKLSKAKASWKDGLKGVSKSEKKDRKLAWRTFRRRVHLIRIIICWVVVLALLAGLGYFFGPKLISIIEGRFPGDLPETAPASEPAVSGDTEELCLPGSIWLSFEEVL